MRTGRALTVSGGGGGVGASQKNFFGGGKLKKKFKKKKNLETPPKIGETPSPRKIGDPPKNWRPSEKLETPRKIGDPPEKLESPRGQNSWHTPMKILPLPNFVAAGNK